jgi:DNA-binding NarL/FixJ family response regulator
MDASRENLTARPKATRLVAAPQAAAERMLPLPAALWAAVIKELRFSEQQDRIVGLLLLGLDNKAIAGELGITVPTLRTYLDRIYRRTGVSNRVTLAVRVFVVARVCEGRGGCPPS